MLLVSTLHRSVPVASIWNRLGEVRLAERQQRARLQLPQEDRQPDAAEGDRPGQVHPVQAEVIRAVQVGPISQNRSTRRISTTVTATPMSVRPFRFRSRESSSRKGSGEVEDHESQRDALPAVADPALRYRGSPRGGCRTTSRYWEKSK